MYLGGGRENCDGKVEGWGCVSGEDEFDDELKEGGGCGSNLKNEFTEACDVYLRDVELFLMCLFKNMPHGGVVCDVLEWYS